MHDKSRRRRPIERHVDPYRGKKSEHFEADNDDALRPGTIVGRNAVTEALRAGRALDKVYIAKGETDPALGHIASKAREAGTVVVQADRRKLDFLSGNQVHQGVVAVESAATYVTIDDILNIARERGEAPLIVVCDEISDPHNLGAIIRSAECAGAHGVIIPKRRSAGVTAIVSKTSAGASAHTAIARVANITQALRELQKAGVWTYAADAEGGTGLWDTDLKGACAIVIGSEGEGLSRLVAETCDFTVSIPMRGQISSLNASVSASLILYEALRQRLGHSS
ncbi:MAG TPA: 23S rRNA (guanosine(2251)-2'-O)-methyltransferase RlmB [Papillibacter sp.]|jgi:23S rRNA (guanosine2251-2'-O)-methyltransferase|nr:23S rRNA (guanosine(2251)-2'-O)-methyltransferase RlmB [Papillibacter sp.]